MKIIYSKHSNERSKQFNIRTDIFFNDEGSKVVVKIPTNVESKNHVKKMIESYNIFEQLYVGSMLTMNKCKAYGDGVAFEFVEGKTLEEKVINCINEGKIDEVEEIKEKFVNTLRKYNSSEKVFVADERFIEVFGDNNISKELIATNYANIDLCFFNIIEKDEKWTVIDYEWCFDFDVPLNFIIFRALYYMLIHETEKQDINIEYFEKYDISSEEIEAYLEMEKKFQEYVKGGRMTMSDFYQVCGRGFTNMEKFESLLVNEKAFIENMEKTNKLDYANNHPVKYAIKRVLGKEKKY